MTTRAQRAATWSSPGSTTCWPRPGAQRRDRLPAGPAGSRGASPAPGSGSPSHPGPGPGPTSRHLVLRAAQARFLGPPAWAPAAIGARRWPAIDDQIGAAVGRSTPGSGSASSSRAGACPGTCTRSSSPSSSSRARSCSPRPEGSFLLGPDDYGLVPVGVPHAWRNEGGVTARWADMLAPQPRRHYHGDTMQVDLAHEARAVRPESERSADAVVRPYRGGQHERSVAGRGQHADRAAGVQRDHGQDDGRHRPRGPAADDVHGAVRGGRGCRGA